MATPAQATLTADLPAAYMTAQTGLEKDLAAAKTGLDKSYATAKTALEEKSAAQADMGEFYKKSGQKLRDFAAENPYPMPDIKPWEDKLPEPDPAKAFGGWASAFGILAGAITKRPLKSSLNASAAAMNAVRENDLAAYADAKQSWKENTELAIKQAEWEAQAYDQAWELMKTDQKLGEAQLQMVAAQTDNKLMLAELQAGNLGKVWEMTKSVAEFARTGPEHFMKMEALMDQQSRLRQLETQWLADNPGAGAVPPDVKMQFRSQIAAEARPDKELTPGQMLDTTNRIATFETMFDDMDMVKNEIDKLSAGFLGKFGRPAETLGNLFEMTDDVTKSRIEAALAAIKSQYMFASRGSSWQPSGRSLDELEKMMGAEASSATVQNVVARMDDMQQRLMPVYNNLRAATGVPKDSPRGTADRADVGGASTPPAIGTRATDAEGKTREFTGGNPQDPSNWKIVTPVRTPSVSPRVSGGR